MIPLCILLVPLLFTALIPSSFSYALHLGENTIHNALFGLEQKDVTNRIKLLGNPFTKSTYAKNVWDMQVFNGSIYLGHGNSSNYAPAANAGPIDVILFQKNIPLTKNK